MKKNQIFIYITLLIIGLSSCTERIEVNLDETYTRLVVEGNLTTDTMPHAFHLTQTSSYFYNQPAINVEGAQMKITDDLGNQTILTEKEQGIYCTPNDFFGIPGRSYEMQVDLEKEIGGNSRYEADSKIFPVNKIDSIGMEFNSRFGENGFWIVKLYATDPGGVENFYMFNVYRNGILMTDTLNKVSFVDDKLFDGNFTFGIGVAYFNNSLENQSFKIGDTVILEMSGITKEHFKFMNDVSQATSFQNPLFGGPPANVIGNISNGAFGYFATYSTTYSQLILTEENIIYTE